MGNYTKNGLMFIIIGILISIVASIILFLTNGAINIDFFSGLLLIAGIILMVVSRNEFGKKHKKFVIIALIFYAVIVIIEVIFLIMIFVSIFSIIGEGGSITVSDLGFVKNIFIIVPILAIIGGITYIFLLYQLEDQKGKYLLFIAFFVTIILSFYIALEGMEITDEWLVETEELVEDLENEETMFPSLSRISAKSKIEDKVEELQHSMSRLGAIGLVGKALFLIAFLIPYYRIRSGELAAAFPRNNKRCMQCGRVVPSDSIVCAYCGNKFENLQNYDIDYYQR